MKVLVDTSAWVDFFNNFDSKEAQALERLIREEADLLTCGVVVAEFLQGIRRKETLEKLETHFIDMEWLIPQEPETYIRAAALYRKLRSQGITIRSTIDCLIAQLAADADVLLLSKDRDMRLIIESGLLPIRPLSIQ